MRRISGDYIFPIASSPIKNGVVTISDTGEILAVTGPSAADEHYSGIICPGFVNTHCHLELSHLRSKISEKTGMTGFIREIIGKRTEFSEEEIQRSIADSEAEMIKNGIVAVGDISNNNSTFRQKSKGNLAYHTFIEIFSLDPEKANNVFEKGKELGSELFNLKLANTVSPHAPYTMSEQLLKLINENSTDSILTIHNQESEGENELFISGSGIMFETFKAMGIKTELMRKTGMNSLRSTLPLLNNASKILLVHNTYTSKEDLQWAMSKDLRLKTPDLYWATCPNANLYIENKLPDYNLFIEAGATMTVGTDSLASNWSLSVLDELKTIHKYYPGISLETLLTWATKNGAEFLGFEKLGTLEVGKKPGLNLLTNVDGMRITDKSEVQKLV